MKNVIKMSLLGLALVVGISVSAQEKKETSKKEVKHETTAKKTEKKAEVKKHETKKTAEKKGTHSKKAGMAVNEQGSSSAKQVPQSKN
ncbi:MAG: hypothetical protein ABI199_02620 [Bacteroidia bacterium]